MHSDHVSPSFEFLYSELVLIGQLQVSKTR